MWRWILGFAIGGFAVALLVWGNVRAGPDATVPPALGRWVEPAREAARREAGLAGLLPARLLGARCSMDGRIAVLTFESAVGSVASSATIGFPAPEEWTAPGATVTIIGIDSDPGPLSVEGCARVPTGPPR
ncbi:MAG: hypothetical protein ACLGIJ_12440 [Candidatus Limnocylindria bacterium]